MFAQMKSKRVTSRACPCHGVCDCHKPKDSIFPMGIPILFPIMFPLLVPGAFMAIVAFAPEHKQHVQLNGQDCVIEHITDSCTSTGACSGHDIVVCPSEKR